MACDPVALSTRQCGAGPSALPGRCAKRIESPVPLKRRLEIGDDGRVGLQIACQLRIEPGHAGSVNAQSAVIVEVGWGNRDVLRGLAALPESDAKIAQMEI